MSAFFYIDLFAIFALIFTFILINKRMLLWRQIGYFSVAVIVILIELILELTKEFLIYKSAYSIEYVYFYIGISVGLFPIYLYALDMFVVNGQINKKLKNFLFTLVAIDVVGSFSSIFMAHIMRGGNSESLGRQMGVIFNMGVMLLLIALLPYFLYKQTTDDETLYDKFMQIASFFIPFGAGYLYIIKDIPVFWASLTIVLIVYFVYLLEIQFRYDIQTGLKNRKNFDISLENIERIQRKMTIFVFDLNNLKMINDTYGHETGDKRIAQIAHIIDEVFSPYGTSFRIGGDEFSTLTYFLSDKKIHELLKKLDDVIIEKNKSITEGKLILAHGFYSSRDSLTAHQILSEADAVMYIHKQYVKRKNNLIGVK